MNINYRYFKLNKMRSNKKLIKFLKWIQQIKVNFQRKSKNHKNLKKLLKNKKLLFQINKNKQKLSKIVYKNKIKISIKMIQRNN